MARREQTGRQPAGKSNAGLDERDRDGISKAKSVPTAADRENARNRPARAARKAGKLIDPGR
jgi:hypothetical protein